MNPIQIFRIQCIKIPNKTGIFKSEEFKWKLEYNNKFASHIIMSWELSPTNFWNELNAFPQILEHFGIAEISPETVSAFDYNGDLYTWEDIACIEESVERHTTARF